MAYQDHGHPELRLDGGIEQALALFEQLGRAGIDYDDVTETLERDGVQKFSDSFRELLEALDAKQRSLAPA
jgi:transaldolase